ncbi:MAG: hypothetical protein KAS49_01845 [Candidatus Cloacimonetes bacterium]|nr:hypothetical protein [Candidatus Cloacimonadota bacterium]
MIRKNLFIYIVCFICLSCSSKKSIENEITFEVKYELLGEEYNFSKFIINPPKKWVELSTEQKDLLNKQINSPDENIKLESAFINELYNSFMFVSRFISNDENEFKSYLSAIRKINIDFNIVESRFFYNGIDIIQLMIMKNENVNIKLICSLPENTYLIDYIVPYEIYREEVKIIESSIGSIKISSPSN